MGKGRKCEKNLILLRIDVIDSVYNENIRIEQKIAKIENIYNEILSLKSVIDPKIIKNELDRRYSLLKEKQSKGNMLGFSEHIENVILIPLSLVVMYEFLIAPFLNEEVATIYSLIKFIISILAYVFYLKAKSYDKIKLHRNLISFKLDYVILWEAEQEILEKIFCENEDDIMNLNK